MTEISSIAVSMVGMEPNPIGVKESFLISVAFRVIDVGEYTIPVTAWKGTGPYYADISVPLAGKEELISYVADFATLDQRVSEYNALIKAEENGTGVLRFWAISIKPKVDLPIKVITGMFSNTDVETVQTSQWQGSGPWTCTLDLGHPVRTALCGMTEGMTAEQARAFIYAGIHVSATSGNTVTLRAMLSKPSMGIPIGILSE
jgi:hypothetical protein